MYAYRRRVEGAALGFTLLNPVTSDGCQLYWSYINLYAAKKISLNSFNFKGRTSKLPLSYLLGISSVITKVKTLDFVWRDSVKPLGVYSNRDEPSSFYCYAFTL